MNKKDLRKIYSDKRENLSPGELERLSREIAKHIPEILPPEALVHVFLPIERKREINTYPLIDQLRSLYPKMRFAISKTDWEDHSLDHFLLEKDTEIVIARYGIPEPVDANPIPVSEIDVVLIPLLAFDKEGNRLGYGKGFYDGFLADCRPDVLKIGLSFFDPVDQILDVDEWDVGLDCAICPSGLCSFP